MYCVDGSISQSVTSHVQRQYIFQVKCLFLCIVLLNVYSGTCPPFLVKSVHRQSKKLARFLRHGVYKYLSTVRLHRTATGEHM